MATCPERFAGAHRHTTHRCSPVIDLGSFISQIPIISIYFHANLFDHFILPSTTMAEIQPSTTDQVVVDVRVAERTARVQTLSIHDHQSSPHDNANPTANQLTKMTEDLHRDITERLRCLELQIRITSHMFIGVAQNAGDDPTNLVKFKDEMLGKLQGMRNEEERLARERLAAVKQRVPSSGNSD
ncbi:hypothetical protein QC761_0094380 [Podospora bellae-mahoneyi]|uniref:Uncharacterized protein n=1 Tax=Podospora bellae-mahoneyi TaxID=2093777 RepID=A0ABR0FC57_9PEZI|nr:hypothetical protein QC761_0094380 [Podospora bellae-mahoneyi]